VVGGGGGVCGDNSCYLLLLTLLVQARREAAGVSTTTAAAARIPDTNGGTNIAGLGFLTFDKYSNCFFYVLFSSVESGTSLFA